mgnify:CR=1 FL=1
MYGILKKKYGQNFLIDKNILTKINTLIPNKNLRIIEIGPGNGQLTDYILNTKPIYLKLIEIDIDLIQLLNRKYSSKKNIEILNEDILKYNLIDNVDLIISNLPYNISSQILVKICLMDFAPSNLILMFQKEFAERLLDVKLNSLNSLVGCFYDIDSSFNVSKNCFRPIPKIDSTVLSFKRKKKILLKKKEVNEYIKFKRSLFTHKRKTLNNLLRNYNFDKKKYDLSLRIEDISLGLLLKIFKEVNF